MATLLLRLQAPMQSWGSRSRFDDRDTELEPTKSGVLGLIASALGIPRDNWTDLEPLTRLRFGVRVDREGVLRTDFHTAMTPGEKNPDVTGRHYLADAAFLVGLEGDPDLLVGIEAAVGNPVWTLFLGRKSFLPACPLSFETGGIRQVALEVALQAQAPLTPSEAPVVRFVVEAQLGSPPSPGRALTSRTDQPVGPFAQRRYASRQVMTWTEPRPPQQEAN